jgi:hypothetical protein
MYRFGKPLSGGCIRDDEEARMNLVKFLAIAALSMAVIVISSPPLKPGRQEVRLAKAYLQARAIQQGRLPVETLDSWESPYRIVRNQGTIVRVVSAGPNTTSPTNGFDDDDIWSDMDEPPHRRFMRARNWRLVLTFALAASPWLIVIVRRLVAGTYLRQHGSRR